jgi:hypothetical protein
MTPPVTTVPPSVDLSHGAQGVVSQLRGTLHGPGPLFRSMPVKDLTAQVPIRKGTAYHTNQTFHKLAQLTSESSGLFSGGEVCPSRATGRDGADWCTRPSRLVVDTLPKTHLAKMPLESLMTAVHEVSEVLHVLGKHNQRLSRALFDRLVSYAPLSINVAHGFKRVRISTQLQGTSRVQLELRHGSECMLCVRDGFHNSEGDCGESTPSNFSTGLQEGVLHVSKGVQNKSCAGERSES